MKNNEELNLPESLHYTDEHVWVRMDGGEAVIGISDFAQDQLGEIAFVDLPAVGTLSLIHISCTAMNTRNSSLPKA